LPVTIFVAPAFVGGGEFWWDTLADARAGALDPGIRDHALHTLAGRDGPVRAWAVAEGFRGQALPDHARVASEADLVRAASRPGVTLASHTWSHPNLARLQPGEVEVELRHSQAWLEQRVSGAVRWLAYPYGLATPEVQEAARRTPHDGAVLISGGWLGRDPGRGAYALPRLNISAGLSDAGFVLRTSGLLT